jgi:energy-coupling factor transport system ATP-binding protein
MPPAPLVSLDRVSYFYRGAAQAALLNVDLAIAPGEIVGLLGATGAGKTTLCLALNGIVPQFHGGRFFGQATVAGLDTVTQPIHALARHVGFVFQDPATQLVTASVETEVAFALENLRVPRAEIRRRIDEALAAVGLADCARKHPHELSGGQQQRLAFAAALAVRPPLIVLDEPTSQLDPLSAAAIFRLVREVNAAHGTAFVITGHASEEIAETAHRLVVLSRGQIVAEGSPETVFRDAGLLARERLRPPEVTAVFSLLAARGLATAPPPVRLADGLRALAQLPPPRPYHPPAPTPPSSGVPILELTGVTHTYLDGTAALRGVSVAIRRRDYVVILGENGAGKSTLVRHFLRLLEPSAGTVLLDGAPLARHSVGELAQRIGYVPQNPDRHLFHPTVEAEVAFALARRPLAAEEKLRRIDAALTAMKLGKHRRAHPFSLAKGDRARVVIAAVLVMEPEVLIFDEPTTGQDDAGAHAILDLTRELHAQGRTIIVVTHHLHLMPGYAERALVLGGGRVLLDAPLRAAYHALDVLAQTHLAPTQAVALARAAHPGNFALTPAELADTFAPPP